MGRLLDTARGFYATLTNQQIPFKSASIAFYTIASLAPFVVLVLAVSSLFDATDMLLAGIRPVLPTNGGEMISEVIRNTSGRSLTSGVGLVVTVWSASRLFRALSVAFADIYRAEVPFGFLSHVARSILVLGGLLLAIFVLAATSVTLTADVLTITNPTLALNVIVFGVLVVVFLPFYYGLPPKSVSVRHALPGTLLAATGWVLLQVVFFYYASSAGPYAAFNVLGALILFVSFLYLASMTLLVGAVLNAGLDY